ncbi:MAG: type IV secretory system conjugative DNA transfer family protein [Ruminococcus sp.]|nr:type IV secretory system conjugative DNA transfer family protein [Ruminococcus sp.]
MKFKISSKDFLIFCLYCILLLYLCAIAVLNFSSFINEGEFYGLNPFPAFGKDYIIITLFMFVVALVIIFTSVSSYVFNKEKGRGFGLQLGEKQESGYARWASEKEIKNDSGIVRVDPKADNLEAAGVPLINNGKEIWVDNGEYHNLVIGSTGSGKTQTVVKPMVNLLAKKGESMIITDPKGEIYKYAATALKERGYKIIVLNFREPAHGNAWNPLTLPYIYYKQGNTDKSTELLDDVALNILYDQSKKGGDSDFWEKSAADYFSGLALGLFYDAKEKEVNLNSINYMSSIGEERYATSTYIKEYFNSKGQESSPYIFASNTINAPNETKGGILSTFRQKIRLFSSRESLSEMLAYSDFKMEDIGREKTAVFMIIHDEKKTYHSLMTIFIKQCYETLIDVAQENGGKLPFRTNFILDEFANMPPLKDVDSMVSAARSRDIRFTFIIQNFAQLNDVYGKEVAEIIKGNCGNLVYLISTELAALEEISKMCGEVKSKEKDKTASTPLVTVSDLQKLKLFEAIIIRLRKNPFKTKLEPDFKMNWGMNREEAQYPNREIKKIELFDVKKFVTEEKRKQMMNNLENKDNGNNLNPFANNFGNPFMPSGMNSMNGMNNMNNVNNFNNPFSSAPINTAPTNFNLNTKPNQGINNVNPNPMSTNPMFNKPMNSLSDADIDAMMKDIDRRLKELDEEEARQKAELEKSKNVSNAVVPPKDDLLTKPLEVPTEVVPPKVEKEQQENLKIEEPFKEENIKETPNIEEKPIVEDKPLVSANNVEKPKINVDADSIIVNENMITDDEFFDDFFGE